MSRLHSIAGVILACGSFYTVIPSALADSFSPTPPPCLHLPAEAVAWWRAENSFFDEVGGFPVEQSRQVQFAAGRFESAWSFDGEQSAILFSPSPRLGLNGVGTNGVTLEMWIAPELTTHRQVLVTWQDSLGGTYFDLFLEPPSAGNLWTIGLAQAGSTLAVQAVLQAGAFQHLAFAYHPRTGTASLFINGALHSAGSFPFGNSYLSQLKFGGKDGAHFKGRLDEFVLYSRILSEQEISNSATSQNAYCRTERPPTFSFPVPYRFSATAGDLLIISPEVQGAGPIQYQWRHYGTNIPAATASTLIKQNISLADAGPYELVASNAYGSITSIVSTAVVHLLANGSFEKGSLENWELSEPPGSTHPVKVSTSGRGPAAFVSAPLEGPYSLSHGFAAPAPGIIRIQQDLPALPAGTQIRFSFRCRWNLEISGMTLPREFRFIVEPAGGADPFLFATLLTVEPNTKNFLADWHTRRFDLQSFADRPVRIAFEWTVPEGGSLLSMFELDAVHLFNNSGPPLEVALRASNILELKLPNAPSNFTLWGTENFQSWNQLQVLTDATDTFQFDPQSTPSARFFQISVP